MRALFGSARLLHLAFGDKARASLSLSLVSLLPLSLTSTSQYSASLPVSRVLVSLSLCEQCVRAAVWCPGHFVHGGSGIEVLCVWFRVYQLTASAVFLLWD